MEGSGPLEKVKRERGIIERLLSLVPGYHGYKERELRRETDRLVRMAAATRLRHAKDAISRSLSPFAMMRLSNEDMFVVDSLLTRLDRVTQRIDRAVAGYAGLYDAVKVREDKLDAVIEHDLKLVERAEAIKEAADSLARLQPGSDAWRNALQTLISDVEEFDRLVDQRVEILRGLIA
ncbi:hypothetical protein DRO33_04675 [Candidatus Bathyarchaeota archaeon]|nr:MAG: hypothetical protein DRO33_04675 [Candidatus Bathyarchaeota archaeon]